MKEIYSFTVSKEEEVTKEQVRKKKNKETGKTEEHSVSVSTQEQVPYRIVLKQPSRRQIEEADMEYSIEMSRCIKKGILTKAMLAKKYSDTGGLLSESDATSLTRLYSKLSDLQNKWLKLDLKKAKTPAEEKKSTEIQEEMMESRKGIVEIESSYQALFNHTAEVKAQNRAILWYLLSIVNIKKEDEEDSELASFFVGETHEERLDSYYKMEEAEGDEINQIFDSSRSKLLSFISLWYFSAGAERSDFESLEADIENDNI